MDLACPNCAATYRVPEALIAQGKPLRCAACGETWVPERPPAPPIEDAPPAEPPEALPAPEPASAGAEAAAQEAAPAALVSPAAPPHTALPLTPPPLLPPVLRHRPPARRLAVALRLAWVGSIATVLLALAGLILYGDAIAAAWPPFARVTALVGG